MTEAVEQVLRDLEQEASEEAATAVSCELAAQHQANEEAELTALQARLHRAKALCLQEFVILCQQTGGSA